MDHENKTPAQRQAERLKYMKIQRAIRMGTIALAIILAIAALCQSCSTKKAVDDLAAKLEAKKAAAAQEAALQAAEANASPSPSAAPSGTTVTLSFVGNCTLASPNGDGTFESDYESYGASYFFQNVKSIFEGDDLTIANLESTLTQSDTKADQETTFRSDPSYADILTAGGVDAVDVANDHTHDYGNEGYVDTLAYLDNAGIGRFGGDYVQLLQVNGISVGFSGVDVSDTSTDSNALTLANIATLQKQGAQIIIVSFHWGDDDSSTPSDACIELAHNAIDAGADLVIGHHPQAMQAIECYKGKYIAYSLGNFCYGGSESCDDMDTMIFQQTFTVVGGTCQDDAEFTIIPCSISSSPDTNNFCPTPASGDEAQQIMDKIYALSDLVDGGIRPEETESSTTN